jgi:hypothetical protein
MDYGIQMIITDSITSENVSDLISTAFEGGINYWCGKAKLVEGSVKEEQKKDKLISDLVVLGGRLILHDAESDDKWELNINNMIDGIRQHCTQKNILPSQLMEDYDADDADKIIQYALFKEQVFA